MSKQYDCPSCGGPLISKGNHMLGCQSCGNIIPEYVILYKDTVSKLEAMRDIINQVPDKALIESVGLLYKEKEELLSFVEQLHYAIKRNETKIEQLEKRIERRDNLIGEYENTFYEIGDTHEIAMHLLVNMAYNINHSLRRKCSDFISGTEDVPVIDYLFYNFIDVLPAIISWCINFRVDDTATYLQLHKDVDNAVIKIKEYLLENMISIKTSIIFHCDSKNVDYHELSIVLARRLLEACEYTGLYLQILRPYCDVTKSMKKMKEELDLKTN